MLKIAAVWLAHVTALYWQEHILTTYIKPSVSRGYSLVKYVNYDQFLGSLRF